MNTALLNKNFDRIGARLKLTDRPSRRTRASGLLTLDIGSDRRGEFFELTPQPGANPGVEVLDIRPSDRHLLLLVREGTIKNKYLCGHDERHWFVAGIPESAPVGTVRQAKEALQPPEVVKALASRSVSGKARNSRKNAAFVRQGEWFFLPVDVMQVDNLLVLRNEPLSRGNGGKPHWAEFCYRTGGETVYVSNRQSGVLSAIQYQRLLHENPNAATWRWRIMQRNSSVFVRGRIRHPDHATITLHDWHQVVMNTEHQSQAMRHVSFLD